MRILAGDDAVDLTAWWRRSGDRLALGEAALGALVQTLEVAFVDSDEEPLPITLREGLALEVEDEDTSETLFSGRFMTPTVEVRPSARIWRVGCSSWGIRLLETATGSLDRSGMVDIDRNHVIAILRDALQNQSFGQATGVDDPIITVNEAAGWPLVQGTAVTPGHDYSYKATNDALGLLMRDIPNVSLRVRADLLVEYGVPIEEAAVALCTAATSEAGVVLLKQYAEQVIVGDHRNKVRLGGLDAAEATATDEVSMAVLGRILEAPYENDESIPAADVEQLAYAKLRAKRIRRRAVAKGVDVGIHVGELVHVWGRGLGPYEPEGPFPDNMLSMYVRSPFDGVEHHYRGEMVVQRLGRQRIGAGPSEDIDIELGDSVLDLATKLAREIGQEVTV